MSHSAKKASLLRATVQPACAARSREASRAHLPAAGVDRGDLLRELAHRGEDHCESQLGGRVRRRPGVLVGAHDDAALGARGDVDMRIHAALADEAQAVELCNERRANLRALADQDQRIGVLQACGEPVCVLQMIVPDSHRVASQLAKAGERAHGVVVVVQYGDIHGRLGGMLPRYRRHRF